MFDKDKWATVPSNVFASLTILVSAECHTSCPVGEQHTSHAICTSRDERYAVWQCLHVCGSSLILQDLNILQHWAQPDGGFLLGNLIPVESCTSQR